MARSVAVVVPSFNAGALLGRLLASLERQTLEHDIVVVDNGSSDGTARLIPQRFPHARVLPLPANLGFGRAINRGVATCDAETLVFVNNDVVCEPDFLESLVTRLDPARGVTMAAGVLVQAAEPNRIDTAGIELDATLLAFDYLHGEAIEVLERDVPDPLGPSGGAAAVDRAAFDAVGGFDENFFAYLEDVDLVLRLVEAGGRCRVAPAARAVHRHSATLGPRSRRKAELVAWSRGYLIGKYRLHESAAVFVRALGVEALDMCGRAVVDGHLVGVRERVSGWRQGLRTDGRQVPREVLEATVPFIVGQRRRLARRTSPVQRLRNAVS